MGELDANKIGRVPTTKRWNAFAQRYAKSALLLAAAVSITVLIRHGKGQAAEETAKSRVENGASQEAIERRADWHADRATEFMVQADYKKAIVEFTKAIDLDPDHRESYHSRSFCRGFLGEYDAAVADANEAIRLRPDAGSYNNRGFLWKNKGEYAKALADYSEAIRLETAEYKKTVWSSGRSVAHQYLMNRAWLLATCPDEKYRDREKAIEDATKSCELSEWKDGGSIATLAAIYAESDDFAEAIKWLKKSMELPPGKGYDATKHAEAQKKMMKAFRAGTTYKPE